MTGIRSVCALSLFAAFVFDSDFDMYVCALLAVTPQWAEGDVIPATPLQATEDSVDDKTGASTRDTDTLPA